MPGSLEPAARPAPVGRALQVREPYDAAAMLGWLGARAIRDVEVVDAAGYRRSVRLAGGSGSVALTFGRSRVHARLDLAHPADLAEGLRRCRRLLDVDVDPAPVAAVLGRDPALAPLVARRPGLRLPGAMDVAELAVRAVLGQQVTLAAARTIGRRLVALAGAPVTATRDGVTRLFPTPGQIVEADLDRLGMPASRRRAVRELCVRLLDARVVLDGSVDADEAHAQLLAVPGIGPWTAGYIRLRGLGDPDVFLTGDAVLRKAAAARGLPATAAGLRGHAERWRPFRSYAMQHLWSSMG